MLDGTGRRRLLAENVRVPRTGAQLVLIQEIDLCVDAATVRELRRIERHRGISRCPPPAPRLLDEFPKDPATRLRSVGRDCGDGLPARRRNREPRKPSSVNKTHAPSRPPGMEKTGAPRDRSDATDPVAGVQLAYFGKRILLSNAA